MRTLRFLAGLACVVAAGGAAAVEDHPPPSENHTIPGINAWSEASKNGFHFQQVAATGPRVTSPRDGVATYLQRGVTDPILPTRWENIAAITGGSMSVFKPLSGSRTVTFSMFTDRVLTPGWTIVSVDQSGGTWDIKPAAGSNDLSMRIRVTAYADRAGAAQLGSIVLRGPDGQAWVKAFEGRRLFTITGINAWNTAKGYGFTFQPVTKHPDERVSDGRDGVDTSLVQERRRCSDGTGVLARVVGGNMLVSCYWYDYNASTTDVWDTTRDFLMFAGKRLAPGWVVRDVVVSGGAWVKRPVAGSDSLEFVYRVSMPNARTSAQAIITSVVLEGPTSASSYQDAFKVK